MKIAVILFAYNRPKYLKKAMASHRFLKGLDYYCFIDYSPIQLEISKIVEKHYKVILRNEWCGLDGNMIPGVTEIFKDYDAVIVIEDDLVLSKDAFYYLVNQLILLEKDKNCGSVSLYKGSEYEEGNRFWGWATWKDRWNQHKFVLGQGGQGLQFWNFHKKNNLYCRCSRKQRAKHIGTTGVNSKWYSKFGIRQYFRREKWGL